MKKAAVIGGDLRLEKVAKHLAENGYAVRRFGSEAPPCENSGISAPSDLPSCLHDARVVVLGLPATYDNETVHAPFCKQPIFLREVVQSMPRDAVLLAGRIGEPFRHLLTSHGIRFADYFLREELTVRNSIPTAEGALQIAMEELPVTLHDSRSLVLGFGRIGKVLAKMLHGIGSDVTCSARRHRDKAWIDCMGYRAADTGHLLPDIEQFDVIFNTVPAEILTAEVLRGVRRDCLIIDLASKPGGVDFAAAKDLGLRVIWALSLPGKVAPDTAGRLIGETIVNILEELD